MYRLTYLSGLLRAGALVAGSCVLAALLAGPAVAQDDLRAQALALDFSPALQQCTFTTFSGGGPDSELLAGLVGDMRGKQIPDRALTAGEERRVGIWKLPNGCRQLLYALVFEASSYYKRHHELPRTGLDFFPELATDDGLRALLTMDRLEALERYAQGIDPITGRFYANLQSPQWAAGAVLLRISTDPAEVERATNGVVSPHVEMMPGGKWQETDQTDKPDKVWWVTIYGEAPGSVLYQSILGGITPKQE